MAGSYIKFFTMLTVSFFVMFALTYLPVFSSNDIFLNLNQAYMAFAMAFSMLVLAFIIMSSMFHNKKVNSFVLVFGSLLFLASILAIRTQFYVKDEQFLRSMIPHHSGAILRCKQAKLTNPEITKLCQQIISSQQSEIGQMKAILKSYE